MAKLLHNLPIEDLNKENDYLGVIDKANLIQTILENNTEQFNEIKMFALYGEWGSGKSTLMKYLEQNLKEDFNTFFFDTWQFEKDENLPQTLLEYLLNKSESFSEEFCRSILKYGGKLFRGIGNSVKIRVPGLIIEPSKLVNEFQKEDITFYEALESFKTEFVRWEDNITSKKEKKYNIIFIDDLDRCAPENVLNLLSAIKLFFTYGKKTIFFFGVDKSAVQQAIQTKYKDIIKSEEYLEKIFDISFSMPKHESVFKLVTTYFDNSDVERGKLNEIIAEFFSALRFTNPRRVKKVLNKYFLLANVKESLEEDHAYTKYIGNITTDTHTGNYFETILSLYFITLKEFYSELFQTIFDFKLKESIYDGFLDSIRDYEEFKFYPITDALHTEMYYLRASRDNDLYFLHVFTPNKINGLRREFQYSYELYDEIKVEKPRIDYYFLKYICGSLQFFNKLKNYSDKSISDIYQGIKQIL